MVCCTPHIPQRREYWTWVVEPASGLWTSLSNFPMLTSLVSTLLRFNPSMAPKTAISIHPLITKEFGSLEREPGTSSICRWVEVVSLPGNLSTEGYSTISVLVPGSNRSKLTSNLGVMTIQYNPPPFTSGTNI